MPVTAELPQRFYEVLGDDIANELVDWFNAVDVTYRTELRDLNELNFARFDARLERRIADLRTALADQRTALADQRTELVRWMLGFWATTLLALAGQCSRCAPNSSTI
jgi:hypothetical protein